MKALGGSDPTHVTLARPLDDLPYGKTVHPGTDGARTASACCTPSGCACRDYSLETASRHILGEGKTFHAADHAAEIQRDLRAGSGAVRAVQPHTTRGSPSTSWRS